MVPERPTKTSKCAKDKSDADRDLLSAWRAIKQHHAQIDQLRNAAYDGIAGDLPAWMPEPLHVEFQAVRDRALKRYRPEEILKFMDALQDFFNWRDAQLHDIADKSSSKGDRPWRGAAFPPKLVSELKALVYIRRLEALGPEKGRTAYLGEGPDKIYRDTVISDRQRKNAQRDRPDGLQRFILDLLAKQPGASEQDLKLRLREVSSLPEDENGFRVEEVTDEVIEWRDPREPAGTQGVSGLKDRMSRARNKLGIRRRKSRG